MPGRRIARLETQLECENHKTIHLEVNNIRIFYQFSTQLFIKCQKILNHTAVHIIYDFVIQEERVDVDVISVPEPTIRISGTDDISRDYEDFKLGVRIFADVHILMTTSSSSGGNIL